MNMERNNGKTLKQAAAAGNMCEKTARNYVRSGKLPSQLKHPREYRTRFDPFIEVWDELIPFLEESEAIEAKTLFEYLQEKYPGKFQDTQLRTLQRRVKHWRATRGPHKEVFFPQEYKPGHQCQSDFTRMSKLGITIQHQRFDHMLYHFVLPHSNWESATICFSESFEALSEGLQNALWELGKVPTEHRTDRLSAAINNHCNKVEFTERYNHLLKFYGMQASKTNPYSGNENGDVEQGHNRLKRYIDQQLMLRGSRDFSSREDYHEFLQFCMQRRNRNKTEKLNEELRHMANLPTVRIEDFKSLKARVTKFSTIRVSHCVYSVSSRLIGESVDVHLYADHLDVYYGGKKLENMPRLSGESHSNVQYRHVIDSLIRKPGAFEGYKYRSCMFPSTHFKMAYDWLKENNPGKYVKTYLKILHMAAYLGEELVEQILKSLIETGQNICVKYIEEQIYLKLKPETILGENINEVNLNSYDSLLEGVLS